MSIHILPPRLANQIAAGEVVERPASVVKELVENSLDSGATRIEIEIEQGGSKRICVRDNGSGIAQEELVLALSRHATSKIHSLDDLEAIMSLGFRGEALASISSVARLTLTSRPEHQAEAWSAYSEGRDMQVKLQPAAHPIGTTVEVLDLFFNTPARRKFLRTEKTEFTHIHELIKRIALSRFDVHFTLQYNGKVVAHYRAATTKSQQEKRLAAICGAAFVRHKLAIYLEHQDLKIHGWITTPEGARAQNDGQFCYVNGRMMRDKLINHAIRQSYENSLQAEQFASYVLFIELDPHQVDVNVHPAKHEVRFHQARLVHDCIYQALTSALAQYDAQLAAPQHKSAFATPIEPIIENEITTHFAPQSPHNTKPVATLNERAKPYIASVSTNPAETSRLYQTLMSSALAEQEQLTSSLGKPLTLISQRYVLIEQEGSYALLSLDQALWLKLRGQMRDYPLISQPLLVPLALTATEQEYHQAQQDHALLLRMGIEIQLRSHHKLLIMGVPQPLRQQNLPQLMGALLAFLRQKESVTEDELADWLTQAIMPHNEAYSLAQAIQLIAEIEQLWSASWLLTQKKLVQSVDFLNVIRALQ